MHGLTKKFISFNKFTFDFWFSIICTALLNNCPQASFNVWHACLGHVSRNIISFLNKNRQLFVTYLFPIPTVCSSCQFAESKDFLFLQIQIVTLMYYIIFIVICRDYRIFLQTLSFDIMLYLVTNILALPGSIY